MARKENMYATSLVWDKDKEEDIEAISKLKNRDRSKYHSIPDYVKAAILAFDDNNKKINYSDAAKKDLINEINEMKNEIVGELSNREETMKTYFLEKVITRFGE